MIIEKSTKIQLLSQTALIGIFVFILVTFIIPGINTNSEEIRFNSQNIADVKLTIAGIDIEEIDEKLYTIDIKLDRIILGLCGEFGGKYCE